MVQAQGRITEDDDEDMTRRKRKRMRKMRKMRTTGHEERNEPTPGGGARQNTLFRDDRRTDRQTVDVVASENFLSSFF